MATARTLPDVYDVKTYGASGLGRDYIEGELQNWEAATDVDMVTLASGNGLDCYADQASFNDEISIAAGTVNASYYRFIRPAAGEEHGGVVGAGVCFAPSGSVLNFVLSTEKYFSVFDLCIDNSAVAKSAIVYKNDYCRAVGNIVKAASTEGCFVVGSGGDLCEFIDNIAYGGLRGFYNIQGGNTYKNNLAVKCVNGFVRTGGTATATNCASEQNTGNQWSGTWTKTTCTDNDGVLFVDTVNNDFRLNSLDTAALLQGTDLSADFTDDIVQDTWGVTWNIGPFTGSVVVVTFLKTVELETVELTDVALETVELN